MRSRTPLPSSLAFLSRAWGVDAAGLSLLAAATAATFFLAVRPALSASARRTEIAARFSDERAKAADLAATLTQLRAEDELLRQRIERETFPLQPADRVNDLLDRVTSLAQDTGLDIDALEPARPVYTSRFGTLSVRITGSGRFPAVTEFISLAREAHPDVAVTSLSLEGWPENPTLEPAFEMTLVWHVAPRSKTPSANAPAPAQSPG